MMRSEAEKQAELLLLRLRELDVGSFYYTYFQMFCLENKYFDAFNWMLGWMTIIVIDTGLASSN